MQGLVEGVQRGFGCAKGVRGERHILRGAIGGAKTVKSGKLAARHGAGVKRVQDAQGGKASCKANSVLDLI